ncbi:GIY-YIG nuclease family protein [Dongshaea marina]|uniref:GIY-YIG nuclease family protein n=1 Tax=Dongshaea marina TaxID=2047966 RepID=UPI000D3E37EF|nr:GIY-YIG nuclease family protein [Dongshaea marina]
MWFLYLVRCANNTLYTGITTDVERRFAEHQAQGGRCAKYLRGKQPLTLAFHTRIGSKSAALKAEFRLKALSKRQKEALLRSPEKLIEFLALSPQANPLL